MKPSSKDVAALNDLLNTLNDPNIAGVEVPPGEGTYNLAATPAAPAPATVPTRVESAEKPLQPAYEPHREPVARVTKLFFTGRLTSGKDFAAAAAGAKIFGFADPLYAMVRLAYGVKVTATEGKDIPGVREMLQIFGNWGRGTITEKYPLTIPRGLFLKWVQANVTELAAEVPSVDWASYGRNPDIWLNACILRAEQFLEANPEARVAITNARFDNEFKALQSKGWQHWHCMVSAQTWARRLAKMKLTPESPQVKDLSETLAGQLDQNVIKQISAVKTGPPLRCIWSDDIAPKPARLHSIETFLKVIGG